MFLQTWRKYLPVITLLMKRQPGTEQTLTMNHTDFERAAGGRKVKFVFAALPVTNGKIEAFIKPSPLAQDLVTLLQEDTVTRQLLQEKDFVFTLKSGFELQILIREKMTRQPNDTALSDISEN